MSDLISIIMPAFATEKHKPYLEQAIDGIVNQTYKDWELIIACDGPAEANINTVKSVLNKYKGINQTIDVYVSNKRNGPGVIRNFASQYARGKYITFHDTDDLSSPTRFERLIGAIDEHGVIASSVCVNTVYEKTNSTRRKKAYSGATLSLLKAGKKIRVPFHFPSAILSRKLFLDMGGFELGQMYSSDATFAIKLGYFRELLGIERIPIIDEELFTWNRHSHSITTTQSNQYTVRKCQKAQRRPLAKTFYHMLIDNKIKVGSSIDEIKDALFIYNNLNSNVPLDKIYSLKA